MHACMHTRTRARAHTHTHACMSKHLLAALHAPCTVAPPADPSLAAPPFFVYGGRLHAGLLNIDEGPFVKLLLDAALSSLRSHLSTGELSKGRLLLRFLSALAAVNVVHASGVLAAMQALVGAAATVQRDSGE
jgi:hypothetical protein